LVILFHRPPSIGVCPWLRRSHRHIHYDWLLMALTRLPIGLHLPSGPVRELLLIMTSFAVVMTSLPHIMAISPPMSSPSANKASSWWNWVIPRVPLSTLYTRRIVNTLAVVGPYCRVRPRMQLTPIILPLNFWWSGTVRALFSCTIQTLCSLLFLEMVVCCWDKPHLSFYLYSD